MAKVNQDTTIREFQNFVNDVYGLSNDRNFSMGDMLSNVERFMMRGLKGVRKKDYEKTKANLLISLSWFMSIMNRLHIDLENAVWKRFPYLCSYCASCPCVCKETKPDSRKDVIADESKRPVTMREFQNMFIKIYPSDKRTVEHAGIHLAEEFGEFSEAIMKYAGEHKEGLFENIVLESADIFSCIVGMFNSLSVDMAKELSDRFQDNCHICHKAPCICSFNSIANFKS